MNTTRIKNFAQESRRILIDGVTHKLQYWGMDLNNNVVEEPQVLHGGLVHRGQVYNDPDLRRKWEKLKIAVKQKGAASVIEEGAYTWFNRLMAIRILSENGYDEPQLDFVSENIHIPLILKRASRGELGFLAEEEKSRIKPFLHDHNRETETFALLLTSYCHSHLLLNRVFGKMDDYTELLLPSNILEEYGFINFLNTSQSIENEDYKKVELIGWLYQFYISEKKDEVFKGFRENKKAGRDEIPAATQIFTTNWIVKYMVENTAGQIWLNHKPDSLLRQKMKYLVDNQEDNRVDIIKETSELKLLDPACGSGHILVEGFDLIYDMYMEEYYTPVDAVKTILKKNLFGLDIDLRAVHLARFALLLKAAKRFPDVLKENILPNIFAMPDPEYFDKQEIEDFLGIKGNTYQEILTELLQLMQQAQVLGSVMVFNLPVGMREFLLQRFEELSNKVYKTTTEVLLTQKIQPYIKVIELLTNKYEAVATNPPYMGSGNMIEPLKLYLTINYKNSGQDLMTTFMEMICKVLINKGLFGIITIPTWLFSTTFSSFRYDLITNGNFRSLIDLGRGIFGSDFGSVTLVWENNSSNDQFIGRYYQIFDKFSLITSPIIKERNFLAKKEIPYKVNSKSFLNIEENKIAYWLSDNLIHNYPKFNKVKDYISVRKGMSTANDDYFLRMWYEVSLAKMSLNNEIDSPKWYPITKGGNFRKWYGNNEYLVNWENNGYEIKKSKKAYVRSENYYFKESLTYSYITVADISFRYIPKGFLSTAAGPMINGGNLFFFLSYLNSKVAKSHIRINSGYKVTYEVGEIQNTIVINHHGGKIEDLSRDNIRISKEDWDNHETSWDFKTLPFLNNSDIENAIVDFHKSTKTLFFQMHSNEEDIDRIFIDVFGYKDELKPIIPLKDITILQEELDYDKLELFEEDFRSKGKEAIELPIRTDVLMGQLISYAIGCTMGRYKLNNPGLHIAHPNTDPEETRAYIVTSPLSGGVKKVQYEIDDDGFIPLMANRGYFSDDALYRFKQFLVIVWGEESLTENLNFLQECIGMSIEDYLVKNFWKDHCKRYKKRPIYWLFSSKNGAFQVLAYMHRMNRFSAQKVREKYLFRHIRYLEDEITTMRKRESSLSKTDARKLEQMIKDLRECEEYNLILKDVSDRQIDIDLDDGVKVNYAKFGKVLAEIK